MNTGFYQTRSVTRHDSSTSLRSKRSHHRVGYICNSNSDPTGFFSSTLDATNIFSPAPITPQPSTESTHSSDSDFHSMSVASFLLDNSSDFVIINNVAEERKPEVVTLNSEMLSSWNSNDLFEVQPSGETSNSSMSRRSSECDIEVVEFQDCAMSPSFDSGNSCESSSVEPACTPETVHQTNSVHFTESTDSSDFTYDFSSVVYDDDGFISFDGYEMKDSPVPHMPSLDSGVNAVLSSSSTTSLSSFEVPRLDEDEIMEIQDDSFVLESLPDFNLDSQFSQTRGNDYFSIHILDLI